MGVPPMETPKINIPERNLATWRRKTPAELRRFGRFNPLGPLILAAVGTISCGIGAACVFVALLILRDLILDWPQIILHLLVATGLSGIAVFVVGHVLQMLGWLKASSSRPPVGICNGCFKPTLEGLERCECGGKFEDSYLWTLNKCPKCKYDLRANAGRCPECGMKLSFVPADRKPG